MMAKGGVVRVEPAEHPDPATGNIQPVTSSAGSTVREVSVVQYFGPNVWGSGTAIGAGTARAVAIRSKKVRVLRPMLTSDVGGD